jgi:hypothetical protein
VAGREKFTMTDVEVEDLVGRWCVAHDTQD